MLEQLQKLLILTRISCLGRKAKKSTSNSFPIRTEKIRERESNLDRPADLRVVGLSPNRSLGPLVSTKCAACARMDAGVIIIFCCSFRMTLSV